MTWRTIITSEKSVDQFLREKKMRGGRGVAERPGEVELSTSGRRDDKSDRVMAAGPREIASP